jgi:hypothetical protein
MNIIDAHCAKSKSSTLGLQPGAFPQQRVLSRLDLLSIKLELTMPAYAVTPQSRKDTMCPDIIS